MIDFECVYADYYDAIFRFCFKKVHHTEQAEDLAQDTFLSFYHAIPSIEQHQDYRIKAYLYRVATNKTIDFLRHKRVLEFIDLDYDRPCDTDFTEEVARQDSRLKAISQLSPCHRDALLIWLQNKSAKGHGSGFKMTVSRARKAFIETYRRQEQERLSRRAIE